MRSCSVRWRIGRLVLCVLVKRKDFHLFLFFFFFCKVLYLFVVANCDLLFCLSFSIMFR